MLSARTWLSPWKGATAPGEGRKREVGTRLVTGARDSSESVTEFTASCAGCGNCRVASRVANGRRRLLRFCATGAGGVWWTPDRGGGRGRKRRGVGAGNGERASDLARAGRSARTAGKTAGHDQSENGDCRGRRTANKILEHVFGSTR